MYVLKLETSFAAEENVSDSASIVSLLLTEGGFAQDKNRCQGFMGATGC